MSYEKRLEEINHRLFGPKLILESKSGDTVYYTGGYYKNAAGERTEIDKDDTSFTIGNQYILRHDTITSDYDNFLNIRGKPINGHVHVMTDDTGGQNGWAAALFATEEEYEKLKKDGIL